MSGVNANYSFWSRLESIKIWELAVLMTGIDPRALTDVCDENGDPADFAEEERMLLSAVLAGKISAVPSASLPADTDTEILTPSVINWFRARGKAELASNLAGTPVVLLEAVANPRHPMHAPELRIALEVWADYVSKISTEDGGPSTKSKIEQYLRDNYEDQLGGGTAIDRLSTILNPNKRGGRPRIEPE